MSQANVFGIAINQLIPGPDFAAGPSGDGKYTGSQTFTCRKFDFSTIAIQSKLVRGTPAPTIYPSLGAEWNFLYIASARHEHQPGGITKIFVEYEGASSESPEIQEDDRSLSYSLAGSLTEKSLLSNPAWINALSSGEMEAIAALVNGTGRQSSWASSTSIPVVDNFSGEIIGTITSTDGLELYNKVIIKGETTYLAPAVEWTETKTNLGLISQEDVDSLGYIATPPGSPPTFDDGRNWLFSGISQERTFTKADEVKTWSKTYTLSPPGEPWNVKTYTKVP